MKILHVSDLHARVAWFKWLIEESAKYDIVCIAGDLLDLGRDDVNGTTDDQIDLALNNLIQVQAPLALCSGNHDLIPVPGYDTARWAEPLRRRGVFTDRSVFWFRDYRFRCVPYCDPLPLDTTQEDFWLVHAPPHGARTSTVPGGVSFGCEELRNVCLGGHGPLFALSGHVHASLGFWGRLHHTISLNPGRGDHPDCPNHIVIDLEQRVVTHHKATLSGIKLTTFNFNI